MDKTDKVLLRLRKDLERVVCDLALPDDELSEQVFRKLCLSSLSSLANHKKDDPNADDFVKVACLHKLLHLSELFLDLNAKLSVTWGVSTEERKP